jgi:hypothetical protein
VAQPRARHRRAQGLVTVVGPLVAVAVVGGAVAVAFSGGDSSPYWSARATATASPTPEPTVSETITRAPSAATVPAAATACRDSTAAAQAAVDAARIGVDHWAAHVQARTDLLAGKITEDEMRAIWKATRLAGPNDVAALTKAVAAYEPQADACGQVERSTAPSDRAARVEHCLQRHEAAQAVVDAGRAAVGDWESHLEAMARFKAGDFDAAHAQHLWVQAWEKAPVNINAFRTADQALQKAPACELPS